MHKKLIICFAASYFTLKTLASLIVMPSLKKDTSTLSDNSKKHYNTVKKDRTIKGSICKEVSTIADNENVWIDYNEQETHKHVSFIVDKRYMAPSCNTLINEGLCVGKCWRYGE